MRLVGQEEQGAVLVLTAFLSVIIFAFIAFGIDFTRRESRRLSIQKAADLAALNAMQAYWNAVMSSEDEDLKKRHEQGYQTALEAANGIAIPFFRAVDSKSLAKVKTSQNTELGSESIGEIGSLEYGLWHYREPADSCDGSLNNGSSSCPCSSGSWRGPCFEKLAGWQGRLASSMRIRITTPEKAMFSNFFGSVLGQKVGRISGQATAALVKDERTLHMVNLVSDSSVPVTTAVDTP